jgi:hypothetical protein
MLLPTQVSCGLNNSDFKRQTHRPFKQVPPSHRTITQAEHGMKVQAGFAVIPLRNIA